MDLPTFIVILFLMKGTVYTHTEQAPSAEACVAALPNVVQMIKSQLGESPKFYSAACLKMKPNLTDA